MARRKAPIIVKQYIKAKDFEKGKKEAEEKDVSADKPAAYKTRQAKTD